MYCVLKTASLISVDADGAPTGKGRAVDFKIQISRLPSTSSLLSRHC
jgi:hypothetical protein